MKKEFLIVIILAAIIIVLTVLLFVPMKNNKQTVIAPTAGITVNSPKPNETVSAPLKITGVVTGNGWAGFEGQVGTVKLLDSAGKELAQGVLTATTEWTTLPTSFETSITFKSFFDSVGTLVFHNENPSGDPARDKTFILPINVKASTETMAVKVYFMPKSSDTDCGQVDAVERVIPKTQTPATAAVEELLKGPINGEEDGYSTSLNPDIKLQSLKIENGTAKVDFDETLEKNVGGSCRVTAIRAEITQTLKQFPTVQNVVISINGRTQDILQP